MDDKGKRKEEKMTPEEKLFRVIAAGGRDYVDLKEDEEKPSGGLKRFKFLRPVEGLLNKVLSPVQKPLGNFRNYFHDLGSNLRHSKALPLPRWASAGMPSVSLKSLNKGFVVLAGILILYLLGDMLFGQQQSWNQNGFRDFGKSQAVQIYPMFPQENVRPVSYYLTPITNRNVFMPPGASPGAAGEGGDAAAAQPAPAGYKLVGISWDDQGFVAMIESPDEQGARFVRKGDELPKGVKVKDVQNYSVVLTSGNQKWELS